MSVKQVPIEYVVNAGYIIRSAKDGECKVVFSCQRQKFVGVVRITLGKMIEVYGEQLKDRGSGRCACPSRVESVEDFQVLFATR